MMISEMKKRKVARKVHVKKNDSKWSERLVLCKDDTKSITMGTLSHMKENINSKQNKKTERDT
jgi:hypothetical protein